MQAGRLRHRIEVQSAQRTQDPGGHGQEIMTWQTDSIRSAEVKPLRGRALFEAQQVDNRITTEVTLRWFAGLTPQHRFLFKGKPLNIVFVPDTGKQQQMMSVMVMEASP